MTREQFCLMLQEWVVAKTSRSIYIPRNTQKSPLAIVQMLRGTTNFKLKTLKDYLDMLDSCVIDENGDEIELQPTTHIDKFLKAHTDIYIAAK